ncbi:DUF3152 domain-containing protein [Streptomyces argyrophylli]|uniref:DUF3152 domain-containing protein n=1 Tax=Streptomyces argyrophylli TaxID=2726118 RepID=UPI0014887BBE|nr:DUF3152 domain-containing protein [Streptomyces argyrophyllae]
MGRHSRRGPAPKGDSADIAARRGERRGARSEDERGARSEGDRGDGLDRAGRLDGGDRGNSGDRGAGGGAARLPGGSPAGAPRAADGTPARGVPRAAGGTPARGVPRAADATPAGGVPKVADGTPARGVPGLAGGASARGARGGHPEQREAGGGWGELPGRRSGTGGPGVVLPRQRQAEPGAPGPGGARRRSGPRQEYLEAFDGSGGSGDGPRDTGNAVSPAPGAGVPAQRGGTKGWAFTGIAAAAVTTVLAVVVAGQVTKGQDGTGARSRPAAGTAGEARLPGDLPGGPAPSGAPSAVTLTYDQKMGRTYPLDATLKGPGKFEAVPGSDKAPGTGRKYRYRVDVEEGLGLDGALFAEAVQRTLNDKRSWAHGGARTFERISSGEPDFVITLASPGTTAAWCAKSGLDTTQDNVSCDSAATERVMINAYRWAQGSKTYGDRIHAYRQMLINHEVGHRLGHGHVSCQKDGELAPVMQQQTKFLDHDGIHCRPNPWPYPAS